MRLKLNDKLRIIAFIVFIIISVSINSFAVDNSLTLNLEANVEEIKQGETVTVLVKASNIQGEGIAIFNANIIYDADIFECTVLGDDNGQWEKQSFLENNLTMSRVDLETSTDNQTIAKLVFKVKSDAVIGEQEIGVSLIEVSSGNTSFSVEDKQIKVNIIEKTSINDDDNDDENITPDENTVSGNTATGNTASGNNTTITDNQSNITSNNSKIDFLAKSSIPYAGNYVGIIIIIALIGIIVVGVWYYKYKRTY